jgi:hypothetical protein
MSGFCRTNRRTCSGSTLLERLRCGTRRRLPLSSSAAWIFRTQP